MLFECFIRAARIASSMTIVAIFSCRIAANAQEASPKKMAMQGEAAGEVREFGGELKIKMVWCPAGSFRMGSPENDPDADDNAKPQVDVRLTKGFWLGQTEATQGLWKSVMKSAPWADEFWVKDGPNYPATVISHGGDRKEPEADSAQAFCVRLTALERKAGRLPSGYEFRLPTEAEWEYACRAGSTTIFGFGDSASSLAKYAWFDGNAAEAEERYAHEVAGKLANNWGLYDMHGNASEWCEDLYNENLIGGRNPIGNEPDSDARRVNRSGSWLYGSSACRSAYRYRYKSSIRTFDKGFRLALSASTK